MVWILGEVVLIGLGIMVIVAARLGAFRIPARSQFVMVGDAAPSKNLATLVTGIAAAVMLFGSIGLTLFSSYHPIPAGQVAEPSGVGVTVNLTGPPGLEKQDGSQASPTPSPSLKSSSNKTLPKQIPLKNINKTILTIII